MLKEGTIVTEVNQNIQNDVDKIRRTGRRFEIADILAMRAQYNLFNRLNQFVSICFLYHVKNIILFLIL